MGRGDGSLRGGEEGLGWRRGTRRGRQEIARRPERDRPEPFVIGLVAIEVDRLAQAFHRGGAAEQRRVEGGEERRQARVIDFLVESDHEIGPGGDGERREPPAGVAGAQRHERRMMGRERFGHVLVAGQGPG